MYQSKYICTAQHIFFYESMHTCTNPNTYVTLYYTENRALIAYDPSLQAKGKSLEQYHITVPEYRAPDIFYMKKSHGNYLDTIYRQKGDILTTKLYTAEIQVLAMVIDNKDINLPIMKLGRM